MSSKSVPIKRSLLENKTQKSSTRSSSCIGQDQPISSTKRQRKLSSVSLDDDAAPAVDGNSSPCKRLRKTSTSPSENDDSNSNLQDMGIKNEISFDISDVSSKEETADNHEEKKSNKIQSASVPTQVTTSSKPRPVSRIGIPRYTPNSFASHAVPTIISSDQEHHSGVYFEGKEIVLPDHVDTCGTSTFSYYTDCPNPLLMPCGTHPGQNDIVDIKDLLLNKHNIPTSICGSSFIRPTSFTPLLASPVLARPDKSTAAEKEESSVSPSTRDNGDVIISKDDLKMSRQIKQYAIEMKTRRLQDYLKRRADERKQIRRNENLRGRTGDRPSQSAPSPIATIASGTTNQARSCIRPEASTSRPESMSLSRLSEDVLEAAIALTSCLSKR